MTTSYRSRAYILAPYDVNYCRSGQIYADPLPCIIIRREGFPTQLSREISDDWAVIDGTVHVYDVSEADLVTMVATGALSQRGVTS